MIKLVLITLTSVAALTACGSPSDDPATIPVAGKWVESGEIKSISVNGAFVDPSKSGQMKELLAKYNLSNEICGEPQDLNEEEFQEKMGDDKFTDCSIDSRVVNANRISETASCDAIDLPGVYDRVRFTARTRLHPDRVISDLTIGIKAQNPNTGALMSMRMELKATMTRVGDC